MNGYQKRYKFANGYGASVVSHEFSYGGSQGFFEVAVLDSNGDLCYDTPVTNDVIGYLDFAGVAEVLESIESLEEESGPCEECEAIVRALESGELK